MESRGSLWKSLLGPAANLPRTRRQRRAGSQIRRKRKLQNVNKLFNGLMKRDEDILTKFHPCFSCHMLQNLIDIDRIHSISV